MLLEQRERGSARRANVLVFLPVSFYFHIKEPLCEQLNEPPRPNFGILKLHLRASLGRKDKCCMIEP
jgi:hypothetical protein